MLGNGAKESRGIEIGSCSVDETEGVEREFVFASSGFAPGPVKADAVASLRLHKVDEHGTKLLPDLRRPLGYSAQ